MRMRNFSELCLENQTCPPTTSTVSPVLIVRKLKKSFFVFFYLFPVQISYQSIESSDPGINVPGPRRTVSKLKNETYHMFSNLHPGTTYLISVRARTAKGFGQTALTEITTNISGKQEVESVRVREAARWKHQQPHI